MRKIGKAPQRGDRLDLGASDQGAGRVSGSPVSPWPGPPRIDIEAFLARRHKDETIFSATGTIAPTAPNAGTETVQLSDGTKVRFSLAIESGPDD